MPTKQERNLFVQGRKGGLASVEKPQEKDGIATNLEWF
jgi:hypothetical protein